MGQVNLFLVNHSPVIVPFVAMSLLLLGMPTGEKPGTIEFAVDRLNSSLCTIVLQLLAWYAPRVWEPVIIPCGLPAQDFLL